VRLAHRVRNGNHHPHPLKREHRHAHKQRKVPRIEELHVRDALRRDDADLGAEDVHEPDEDERVRDERGAAELRQVADEHEREEDDELHEDEVLDVDEVLAVGEAHDERLEVLRDEDDVRGDEADLGDDDGAEDEVAHPGAV
jgi:hypothetical protein